MADILREPTKEELTGDPTDDSSPAFVPIAVPGGRVKSVQQRFNERIILEEKKARSKNLPFAIWAVREEIKDISDEFSKKFRRQGYIKGFKIPTLDEIDWDKYSNLKNWELIDEGVKHDPYLSKIHRLPVFKKYKKYIFKGYSNTCTMMEDEESAVIRAQEAINKRQPIERK